MPFVPDFFINSAIIESQGVPKEDARRLGLLPTLLNLPMAQSLLISTLIGRNNVPPPPSVSLQPQNQPERLVRLEDLVRQPIEKAKKQLDGNGLIVEVVLVDVVNKPYPSGTVVDQDPAPDTLVALGTTVTLFVQVDKPSEPGKPTEKAAVSKTAKTSKPAETNPQPS